MEATEGKSLLKDGLVVKKYYTRAFQGGLHAEPDVGAALTDAERMAFKGKHASVDLPFGVALLRESRDRRHKFETLDVDVRE